MNLEYKWMPALERSFHYGRAGHSVRGIVIHSTDGNLESDIDTLTGHGNPPVSVHWLVADDGTVYHFVADDDTAFHAGAAIPGWGNADTIGIEHRHMDGEDPWPDAQIRSSALIVAFLQQQYPGIEVRHHSQIAVPPGRKVDPVDFPGDLLWQYVGEYQAEGTIEAIQL